MSRLITVMFFFFLGIILELRSDKSPITDESVLLQALCFTLEQIFSKGLKGK